MWLGARFPRAPPVSGRAAGEAEHMASGWCVQGPWAALGGFPAGPRHLLSRHQSCPSPGLHLAALCPLETPAASLGTENIEPRFRPVSPSLSTPARLLPLPASVSLTL